MKLILAITTLQILLIGVISTDYRVDPLVLIDQGLVKGAKATDGNYSSFLGIPFAKVNLENPFGPFLQHPGFGDEIFNAVDGTLKCPQLSDNPVLNTHQDIDCLTLNVYVPDIASVRNPLPVIVYIHGGGFTEGYSEENGKPNFVHHDIIVVTPNYRLGVYGFLCLDSPLATGNQGLKDQLEALRWVQRNINSFGGNPNNVTLAGFSAGSISVLAHLYSPHEKLYHKLIAQSGAPFGELPYYESDSYNSAVKLAEYLDFYTNNTEEAIEFLSQTPHNLVTAAVKSINLATRPCKENTFDGIERFFGGDSYTFSNPSKVRNTAILIGNTEHELHFNYFNPGNTNIFYNTLTQRFALNEQDTNTAEEIVRHFYIGDEAVTSEIQGELDGLNSDLSFNYPIQKIINNLLAEGAGSIYFYVFSYSQTSYAQHATDVKYLFNNKWDSEDQKIVSERFTAVCANFAKYGNPTPQVTDLIPITWTPVSGDKRPYLVIDTDIRMEQRFLQKRMAFWGLFDIAYGN